MDIGTKPIFLTPNKLYQVILRNHYQSRPWFVVLNVGVLIAYYLLSTNLTETVFWIRAVGSALLLGVLLYVPVLYWRTVIAPENRSMYLPRRYTFNDTHIFSYIREKLSGENEWDTTKKVEVRKNFYLLYVTASKFLYIPKTSFLSEEDHTQFKRLLWEWHLVEQEPEAESNKG